MPRRKGAIRELFVKAGGAGETPWRECDEALQWPPEGKPITYVERIPGPGEQGTLQIAPTPPVGSQHSFKPTVKLHILPLV